MKRRGFLGFLGGAAVAGPAMAKEAVNSLGQIAVNTPIDVGGYGLVGAADAGGFAKQAYDMLSPQDHARSSLARLLGKSAELVAYEKRQQHVYQIDADIAGMRSLAMHAKIRMQRERNWRQAQHSQKDYFSRVIDGWFDIHQPPEPGPGW